MVAVSGDPLRTNAYAFAHNGILGYPDDEGDPSSRGVAAACSARRGAARLRTRRVDSLWVLLPAGQRASGEWIDDTLRARAEEKGLLARTPLAGEFPRQRVELIRGADPTAEVNRLYRAARLDRRAAHRAAHAWARRRDARAEPARAPRLARRDGAAGRRGHRREGGGQRGDGGLPAGILPGGAGRGPGHPRSRVQPARRADHRRERRAAPDRQRPGGAAARHQRGLGRARPGLARPTRRSAARCAWS